MVIFKWIYLLGVKYRNPSLPKKYKFLETSKHWSVESLHAYQLTKLKKLLVHAYENTIYYKQLFDAHHVDVYEFKSLDNLQLLPILNKQDLLTNVDKIQVKNHPEKCIKATTSGSSGSTLVYFRNEEADSFTRARINLAYAEYGVMPWEKNGYFWGFNFSTLQKLKTQWLDFLQHRFRLFSYEGVDFEKFVKKIQQASYIHGYSSMIYQTAKLINEKKLPKPKKLKLVKGTSEKILDKYKEEVFNAFGVKITSEYGATESGIIAYECPQGNMHINMEGVIVEEIDHEIVVTNLQMTSFPIIRYRLGDYIKLAPITKKCTCGRNHPILEEVTGRIGEDVYGFKHIYPSLYFYYIFKNLAQTHQLYLNYQVVQSKKGFLDFKIEQTLSNQEKTHLTTEIVKYFKEDMKFMIYDCEIIKSDQKKIKSFISTIQHE